ncbi:MAG: transaldolase family protein, partial [Ancrocorticia sp.]
MNSPLKALSDAGVSIWLDDLSRGRLKTGNLADKIEKDCVVGVTTNPTIFAAALSQGEDYAAQLKELGAVSVDEAIKQCTAQDVRDACDLFADIHGQTGGY